ncbi:hypothetical protein GCM10023169_18160 [Georgenia halophila]|uniref:Uncharacterized protein n=1 Tax=Georgenia halophila TaxID=620889 RepID=A0ABP8L784_9MICO
MSTSPTPTRDSATPPRPHGFACEHCDDSVPHEHLDVRALVETSRAAARRRALTMAAVAGVLLAAALGTAFLADGAATALTALGATTAGWVVVTGVALLVTTRTRLAPAKAVVAGALTGAGLTPLAALAVALLAGGWVSGLVAGATWLAAGAATSAVQARSWRGLLLTPGDAGEHARAQAVDRRGAAVVGEVPRWLVQGGLVGAGVVLLAAVPAAVVVLVPLAVLLAARAGSGRLSR